MKTLTSFVAGGLLAFAVVSLLTQGNRQQYMNQEESVPEFIPESRDQLQALLQTYVALEDYDKAAIIREKLKTQFA